MSTSIPSQSLLRVIQPQTRPIITIIGCVHGDEHLGLYVMNAFAERLEYYPGAQFVLANQAAIEANRRSVDQDMNRSFPGDPNGMHEERVAAELLPHLLASRFVLDIHTTTSALDKMTPIVTNMSEDTLLVLNLCNSKEIVLVEPPLGNKSLIGQCRAGVSLEYNEGYAESPEALNDVMRIVRGLLEGTHMKTLAREIFHVTEGVDPATRLPPDTKNFVYSEFLNGFPFLVGEKAYPNGMLAPTRTQMEI